MISKSKNIYILVKILYTDITSIQKCTIEWETFFIQQYFTSKQTGTNLMSAENKSIYIYRGRENAHLMCCCYHYTETSSLKLNLWGQHKKYLKFKAIVQIVLKNQSVWAVFKKTRNYKSFFQYILRSNTGDFIFIPVLMINKDPACCQYISLPMDVSLYTCIYNINTPEYMHT